MYFWWFCAISSPQNFSGSVQNGKHSAPYPRSPAKTKPASPQNNMCLHVRVVYHNPLDLSTVFVKENIQKSIFTAKLCAKRISSNMQFSECRKTRGSNFPKIPLRILKGYLYIGFSISDAVSADFSNQSCQDHRDLCACTGKHR